MSAFNDPVTEQDLPGIGRRYQMTDDSGQVDHGDRASLGAT